MPIEVGIWRLGDKPEKVSFSTIDSEKMLEDALNEDLSILSPNLMLMGRQIDSYINLIQMGARWYDGDLGRFIQPDSIIPDIYNPQTLNRYAYARNNPLKYIDPTGHDIIIVGGANSNSGTDPYDDPSSWEDWIREYTGWSSEKYQEWYTKWTQGNDDDKKKAAQDYGVAIFKWDAVPGKEQSPGNSRAAARFLQKQIDDWGLQDVTIIGHSKGGVVAASLMDLYAKGDPFISRGSVKNMVLIDPPQMGVTDFFYGGTTTGDAEKAGVNAVFIPGQVACLLSGGPPCGSSIKNDIELRSYANDHDIRSEMAYWAFLKLQIYGDAHARRTPW